MIGSRHIGEDALRFVLGKIFPFVGPYLFVAPAIICVFFKYVFLHSIGKRVEVYLDRIGVEICFIGLTFGIASAFSPLSTFRMWLGASPVTPPELFFVGLVVLLTFLLLAWLTVVTYKKSTNLKGRPRVCFLVCSTLFGSFSLVVGSLLVWPVQI